MSKDFFEKKKKIKTVSFSFIKVIEDGIFKYPDSHVGTTYYFLILIIIMILDIGS